MSLKKDQFRTQFAKDCKNQKLQWNRIEEAVNDNSKELISHIESKLSEQIMALLETRDNTIAQLKEEIQ